MRTRTGRRSACIRLGWMVAIALAAPGPRAAEAAESAEDGYPVDPDTQIRIHTASGRVEVRTHDRPVVELRRGGRSTLAVERRPEVGRLLVRSSHRAIRITVPEGADLRIHSASGRVEVMGRTTRLEVRSASGAVTLRGASAEARIGTMSGDVRTTEAVGRLAVETYSGDVDVDGPVAELRVQTVSGDLDVRSERLPTELRVKTVSGDVDLKGDLPAGASWEVTSTSGDVRLRRTNAQGLRLEARSWSGSIELPGGRRESCDSCDRSLVIDGGGAELRFTSYSGDVDIR